ncbi:MAG: hypothetical protein IJE97_01645, partial [Thermoguttaceae bacterium]|nr:hypothetical protein [Thermoguttaceae bacterium]
GLVEEALERRETSPVCDWARSGSATLRFACGCELRLDAVPGEFEEHTAYDGYEGSEFDEEEDKEAAFESLAPAEFLLYKRTRRFERLSTERPVFAQLRQNRYKRAKLTKRRQLGDDKSDDFSGIRRTCVPRVDKGLNAIRERIVFTTVARAASNVAILTTRNPRRSNCVAFGF